MKTNYQRFLKTYNVLLSGLLAILGFASSCESRDEYGTPSAKFIVNGTVKSAETNMPIPDIRVTMTMQGDTSYTDSEGSYLVTDQWGFPADQTYNLRFQDIDGETNKQFIDLDTTVVFKDPEFSGGDGNWYSGETSKEFNVKLRPKK
ncbi:MAG TPA: radical SAM-associated putative lipoprotein [Bacteroidales bacterium]|jgi:putative lipoprotein (rSAM/lipoprotein system)|nr:radical SAM-associated putative lipoprotein [Bacteroidales bacterium]